MARAEISKLSKVMVALTNLRNKAWGIKESILKGIIYIPQGEIRLHLKKRLLLFTTKVMDLAGTLTF